MKQLIASLAASAALVFVGTASAQTKPATPTPTPTQKLFGTFAPKFTDLTDNVLNGDVWERPGLSKHDRSLITVAALIATNHPDQLRVHLLKARENGVTQEELVETITHLGFYAGWPSAYSAMTVAKEVLPAKK